MPTYEYKCDSCNHCVELIQSMSEKEIDVCPQCKNKSFKRLISLGSFLLKGEGWYKDLYSKKS